jgi:hypothetical protein
MSKKTPKVKVLYQNLGGTWYAFTAVNEDVFFGKVSLKSSSKSIKQTGANPSKNSRAKAKKAPLDA